MSRVKFILIDDHIQEIEPNIESDILLCYFLDTFRTQWDLPELIQELEQMTSGKKTFDEIQDPNGYLTFGEDAGYLECDKKTANLISWNPDLYPDIEMPLKELIAIMKEWQAFLGV